MGQYDSGKFKKLQVQWYKRLESEGFEDAEVEKEGTHYLKDYHSTRFQTKYGPERFEAKESYYRYARFFGNYYVFHCELYRSIWNAHAEGTPLRRMAASYSLSLYKVHLITQQLAEIMKKVCG